MRMTISESSIRKLSRVQRNLLIDHIDGEVEISVRDHTKALCRQALIRLGFLRGSPSQAIRPRATALTERGRMAVALILGDYADALVRSGLLEQENPLAVLRQLKALRVGAFGSESILPDDPETPLFRPGLAGIRAKRA